MVILTGCRGPDSCIPSGGAAVAAHLEGCWLPRRGAEAFPMVQTIQLIIEILPS